LYAHRNPLASKEASSGDESRDGGRTREPPLDAVISETSLSHWLARAEAASTEDGSFATSTLLVILEAFPCAALIARSDGIVLLASSRANADLDAGTLDVRACLAGGGDSVTVYPLGRGSDGYERAFILRSDPVAAAATRLARATERWGLTPYQAEVLGMLVQGEGNKIIAERRGCSLRTVEVHMTALFRRSRTASRAELIARFWTFG
jgi:DNA-binding CsgD family transcriptional regulator